MANKISSVIMEFAFGSIPNKTVAIRPRDQPWMHDEIRNLIRRRMILYIIKLKKTIKTKFGLSSGNYAIRLTEKYDLPNLTMKIAFQSLYKQIQII